MLAAAGAAAGQRWYAQRGAGTAAALSAVYLGGFGASHPLAKKIGAWPSVLGVAAVAAGRVVRAQRSSLSAAPAERPGATLPR